MKLIKDLGIIKTKNRKTRYGMGTMSQIIADW